MAGGEDFNGMQPPILATSIDNGVTWTKANLATISTYGVFYGSSIFRNLQKSIKL
jgi:hypothetical protein